MIKVDRSSVPEPDSLRGSQSKGGRERARAEAFYRTAANREKSFDFEAYKDEAVKAALNALFQGKCAYCESRYAATQPMDVEHFRPKGAVVVELAGPPPRKELRKPGYWWLAAEWSNLLPSCTDCNRAREQELGDGGTGVAGKANQFPVRNESKRARGPGEEQQEDVLLIDPTRDDPNTFLEFIEEGLVRPRLATGVPHPKGQRSIEVYALQRRGLVTERRDHLLRVLDQIERVEELARDLQEGQPAARVQPRLTRELAALKRMQLGDQPYAGMTRQFVRERLSLPV